MNRVSDERLDQLQRQYEGARLVEWASLARELRDYRKTVREYLEAVDALKKIMGELHLLSDRCELEVVAIRAEATLRALKERT